MTVAFLAFLPSFPSRASDSLNRHPEQDRLPSAGVLSPSKDLQLLPSRLQATLRAIALPIEEKPDNEDDVKRQSGKAMQVRHRDKVVSQN
jgi:hypothetical protein